MNRNLGTRQKSIRRAFHYAKARSAKIIKSTDKSPIIQTRRSISN